MENEVMTESKIGGFLTPRSEFFKLAPIAIGTEDVESLTSYICRLAEEHCVRVSSIVTGYIFPQTGISTIYDKFSSKINGICKNTHKIVAVLEKLTTEEKLDHLTMLKFENIISNNQLMKGNKAWCPFCFEDMKERSLPIYEKLIWNIKCVSSCHIHMIPLTEKCPFCNSIQRIITPKMRNGFCDKCKEWLGNKNSMLSIDNSPEFQNSVWIEKSIGTLLEKKDNINFDKATLAKAFIYIKNHLFQKPMRTFPKQKLKIGFGTYMAYVHQSKTPGINILANISFYFNIPLIDIITNNINKNNVFPNNESTYFPNKRVLFNSSDVKEKLEKILSNSENFPIRMDQFASELGFSAVTIRKYLPDMYEKVKEINKTNKLAASKKMWEERYEKIEHCVIQLLSEGKYPSQPLIKERLPFFNPRNEEQNKKRRETFIKLGINMRKKK